MFYKGSHLVAIYPVFIQKQGMIQVALSPPSRSYMLYLGPVIAEYELLKQDKKESYTCRSSRRLTNLYLKQKDVNMQESGLPLE